MRPDSAHDGIPVRWLGENPPPLPEGQKWVPIEDRPESIPEGKKLVPVLSDTRVGWDLVDFSAEEIAAKEAAEEEVREREILKQIYEGLRDGEGTGTQRIRRLERVVAYLMRQIVND